MEPHEIEKIVETATKRAVHETLISLGLDPEHPLKSQKTMAALGEMTALFNDPEYQADQIHLRKWRMSMESASKIGFRAVVTVIFTGMITALYLGMVQMFRGGSP